MFQGNLFIHGKLGKSVPDTENVAKLCKALEIKASDISDGLETKENSKKISLKKILKIVLIIILVTLVIYIAISIKKYVIINMVNSKIATLDEYNNYYVKFTSFDQDGLEISNMFEIELYVKESKYKMVTESSVIVGDIETDEEYAFYEDENLLEIHTGDEKVVTVTGIKEYIDISFNNDITDFIASFNPFLKAYKEDGNYCFNSKVNIGNYKSTMVVSIDSNTGFPVQTVNYGSDGVDNYKIYEISTDTVADEDFEMSDLMEYTVSE